MVAATLVNLDIRLPPRGRLLQALDPGATLVGTCFIMRNRPDTAETKRPLRRTVVRGLGRGLAERALPPLTGDGLTQGDAPPESETPSEVEDLPVCSELVLRPAISSVSR
jgi:hypothetical protein